MDPQEQAKMLAANVYCGNLAKLMLIFTATWFLGVGAMLMPFEVIASGL